MWVNNAMTSVFAPFTEISAEEFHGITEVTYLGVVHGTIAVAGAVGVVAVVSRLGRSRA